MSAIERIVQRLKAINEVPKYCDLARFGPLSVASMYSQKDPKSIIRESTTCGMDPDRDTAILKALVEWVERRAMRMGQENGFAHCGTERSDGLAAFPVFGNDSEGAARIARQNAFDEAVERFAWSRWWDNSQVSYTLDAIDEVELDDVNLGLVRAIESLIPVEEKFVVQPEIKDSDRAVCIIFFRLKDGGVLSGGACSAKAKFLTSATRALGELARHAACAVRIFNGAQPVTFYERRLSFMLSPEAGGALLDRLRQRGTQALDLPQLLYDDVVPHDLSNVVAVHRCFFVDQPPFIGGALERLCL